MDKELAWDELRVWVKESAVKEKCDPNGGVRAVWAYEAMAAKMDGLEAARPTLMTDEVLAKLKEWAELQAQHGHMQALLTLKLIEEYKSLKLQNTPELIESTP